ncbi:hypothetical protein AB3S75_000705 [Citrus x aurantiifolia]
MATNKERIERIEADIGNLQNKMEQIEIGINDKLQRLEDTLSKLAESFSATRGIASRGTNEHIGSSRPFREESEGRRPPLPTNTWSNKHVLCENTRRNSRGWETEFMGGHRKRW